MIVKMVHLPKPRYWDTHYEIQGHVGQHDTPNVYYGYIYIYMGVSLVKHTTPLPCICFSESDSKLYTNFEFYEGKNLKHLRSTLIYKAK
jgi:hypothetical protein